MSFLVIVLENYAFLRALADQGCLKRDVHVLGVTGETFTLQDCKSNSFRVVNVLLHDPSSA